MEPRNETQLTERIKKEIMKSYPQAWILKVHGAGYQRIGVPDLLVCVDGRLHGIEVKHQKPGESRTHAFSRVSRAQRKELADLRRAGSFSGVALSVEDALKIISGIDPEAE